MRGLVPLVRGVRGLLAAQRGLRGLRGRHDAPPSQGSQSSCNSRSVPFSVVPCSCCDEDRVMDFMCRTFFREEPILVATGLNKCPPQALVDHTRASFQQGLSLMAVLPDRNDEICGVAINGIVGHQDACDLRDQAAAEICLATRRVLQLWSMMMERPEIWCDPETGRAVGCMLELRELATDAAMRGQGVGLQLALAAREVANNVGAPCFKIDCTSQYSSKIAEKLGMTKVFSLRYSDCRGTDGKPIFDPPCPHEEAAVYIQRLSTDCQHKFGGEF